MKKYLNNKVYDTTKARYVCSDSGNAEKKSLYQKKNSEFFFHVEGSTHRRAENGEIIVPTEYEEAESFARENATEDAYNRFFGQIEDTGKRVQINVSMSSLQADKVRKNASKMGIAPSEYILRLISDIFD